jgi:hypothetical protein
MNSQAKSSLFANPLKPPRVPMYPPRRPPRPPKATINTKATRAMIDRNGAGSLGTFVSTCIGSDRPRPPIQPMNPPRNPPRGPSRPPPPKPSLQGVKRTTSK